jgi:hypothetical protein
MEPISVAISVQAMVLRDVREQIADATPQPGAVHPASPDVILTLSAAAQRLTVSS